jgi:OOP family OmpA-OmpF porin
VETLVQQMSVMHAPSRADFGGAARLMIFPAARCQATTTNKEVFVTTKTLRPMLSLLMLASLAGAPARTFADGGYFGLEGGANFLSSQDVSQDGTNLGNLDFKTGYAVGLTSGHAYASGLRPEFELAYRSNRLSSASAPGGLFGGAGSASGREDAITTLINLWFDLDRQAGLFHVVHPYLGGGLGGAIVGLRSVTVNGTRWDDDADLVFAYQGGAGLSFDLPHNLKLSLDYRYVQTNRGSFRAGIGNGDPVDLRYRTQTAMLTLRFPLSEPQLSLPPESVMVVPVLEAPPPAPQPPAPPCQPPSMGQPIILAGCRKGDTIALRGVNFEFNSAKLTVNARALLDQVAAALQARKDIDVEIDGHTDGKGSDPYNQKLSQERAASVRQYLADRGVDAGRMSTKGFGKSMPVADNSTDEGRELNRRVELKVTAASAPVGETGGTAPR